MERPYQKRQVLCNAKNCTHWQTDYNKDYPEDGLCGCTGVYIDKDGKCKNFCDVTKEPEE